MQATAGFLVCMYVCGYLPSLVSVVRGSRSLSAWTMPGWYHTTKVLSCMAASMLAPSFQQILLTIEPADPPMTKKLIVIY